MESYQTVLCLVAQIFATGTSWRSKNQKFPHTSESLAQVPSLQPPLNFRDGWSAPVPSLRHKLSAAHTPFSQSPSLIQHRWPYASQKPENLSAPGVESSLAIQSFYFPSPCQRLVTEGGSSWWDSEGICCWRSRVQIFLALKTGQKNGVACFCSSNIRIGGDRQDTERVWSWGHC